MNRKDEWLADNFCNDYSTSTLEAHEMILDYLEYLKSKWEQNINSELNKKLNLKSGDFTKRINDLKPPENYINKAKEKIIRDKLNYDKRDEQYIDPSRNTFKKSFSNKSQKENEKQRRNTDFLEPCSTEYCKDFLRQPIGVERPCANGTFCIANHLHKPYLETVSDVELLLPQEETPLVTKPNSIKDSGFICREFLTPSELKTYQRTRKYPTYPKTCLLCNRYRTTQSYQKSIQKNEESIEILQDHYNVIDEIGGYKKENCILPSESSFTGIYQPIVKFSCQDYIYHYVPLKEITKLEDTLHNVKYLDEETYKTNTKQEIRDKETMVKMAIDIENQEEERKRHEENKIRNKIKFSKMEEDSEEEYEENEQYWIKKEILRDDDYSMESHESEEELLKGSIIERQIEREKIKNISNKKKDNKDFQVQRKKRKRPIKISGERQLLVKCIREIGIHFH